MEICPDIGVPFSGPAGLTRVEFLSIPFLRSQPCWPHPAAHELACESLFQLDKSHSENTFEQWIMSYLCQSKSYINIFQFCVNDLEFVEAVGFTSVLHRPLKAEVIPASPESQESPTSPDSEETKEDENAVPDSPSSGAAQGPSDTVRTPVLNMYQ